MEPLPGLAIVGAGRVGGAISNAARAAGVEARVAGRDDALDACRRAEVALLCVPDDAIERVSEAIAPAVPPLRFVGHTSGATSLDALDPVRHRGAGAFSLHPLQTVPDADAELTGAPCAIAGSDAGAERLARQLAARLELRAFLVPEEARSAYHAAASIASNFLVALEESAVAVLDAAGIEDGRELLGPLVLRTATNWVECGGDALTGPIARGDEATVVRHLDALESIAPELRELYLALAGRTRGLAREPAGAART